MTSDLRKLLIDSATHHHIADRVFRELADKAVKKGLADEADHLRHLADLQLIQETTVKAYIVKHEDGGGGE